jgi:uncharacterized protein (UPF0335 family)
MSKTETVTDLGNKSAKDLADFISRIESLEVEKREVAERIKAEYAEAAGVGFDKDALRAVIKERKADGEKTVQRRAVIETYRRALGALSGTPLGDWARGWMADDARHKQRGEEAAAVFDNWLVMAKAGKPDAPGDGDTASDGEGE